MAKPISDVERQALERFRDLEISIEQLGKALRRRMAFSFAPSGPYIRQMQKHSAPAEPGVPVALHHLREARGRWKSGEMSREQLADWAAMLSMNDDYELLSSEEDMIAEWLSAVVAGEDVPSIDPC